MLKFLLLSALAFLAATFSGGGIAHAAGASPFVPAGKPAAKPAAPATNPELEALQLSGISSLGPELRFSLFHSKTKKSFWIGLNQSAGGFTVTSYDPKNSSVVVEHGGFSRRIWLRKATVLAETPPTLQGPPVALPEPVAFLPDTVEGVDEIKDPQTPEEIKQAEYEARMLVSDLLEISMRERERQRLLREQQKQQ